MRRSYSHHMDDLISALSVEARFNPDPAERERFRKLWRKARYARDDYIDIIQEAKNLGIRNPDFDGDWMGRPDDDFDE